MLFRLVLTATLVSLVWPATLVRAQDTPPSPTVALDAPTLDWALHRPCAEGQFGCFLDASGAWVDEHEAHDRLRLALEPDYGRSAVEMLIGLALGAVWYWSAWQVNKVDWDLPPFRDRLNGEAVRLDSNDFAINYAWHAMSGSAFYGFSRANGLNIGYSLLYATVASTIWEYILEWNEKISRNDLLVTPMAGLAVGEFWYRLGRYVTRPVGGYRRPWQRALAWTFGVVQSGHDAIDDAEQPSELVPADRHGYSADLWHGFRTWFAVQPASAERIDDGGAPQSERFVINEMGFYGEFVALPGFMRPGHFSHAFYDAEYTSLLLRVEASGEGTGVEVRSDTIPIGFYAQNMRRDGDGIRGVGNLIGIDVAYLYRRQDFGDAGAGWQEAFAPLHLPGLGYDLFARTHRAGFRLGFRINADYAGVNSLPFPEWLSRRPAGTETKQVLETQGYYYTWGWSWRARAELTLPYVSLGGRVEWGRYDSIEGQDRHQETITLDADGRNTVWDYEVWIRVQPFLRLGRELYFEAAARGQRHEAQLDEVRVEARLDRVHAAVGTRF